MSGTAQLSVPQGVPSTLATVGSLPEVPVAQLSSAQPSANIPPMLPATQSLPASTGQPVMVTNIPMTGPAGSSPLLAMPPASPPSPMTFPATQFLPPNAGQLPTLSSPPLAMPPASPPTPMRFPATQSLPPNAGQLPTSSSPPLAMPPASPPTPMTLPATQSLPPNASQLPTLSSPPFAMPPASPPTPMTFPATQSLPPNAGQLPTMVPQPPPQSVPQMLPATQWPPPTACQYGVAMQSPPPPAKYPGMVASVPHLQSATSTHAKATPMLISQPTCVQSPQPPLKIANNTIAYKASEGLHSEQFGSQKVSGYSTALEMFPVLFTIFCFVIYIIPIWLTYQIGKDDQVQRWITKFCWVVLLLPLLYLFTHVYHVLKGVPNKILVVICLLGSSVFLLVLGDTVLLQAYYRGSEFAAQDCLSFPAKHGMEIQFQNAKTYYANCVNVISNQTGVSIPAAVSLYRITDCMNYNYQVKNNPDWPYLQRLEETYRCGGWCSPGQPLWTFQFTKDSCSRAVADTLRYKVKWSMLQVVVYSLVTLGLACSILLLLPSLLQQQGMEW